MCIRDRKYTDGQAVTAGTDGYFTFYMSAKTKIDSSDKTWEDGYACKQRVNFGGKADVANMKNLVSVEWWTAAGVRAAKTAVQTGLAMFATQAASGTLNVELIAETAFIAGVASLGTSLAGLPEVKQEN